MSALNDALEKKNGPIPTYAELRMLARHAASDLEQKDAEIARLSGGLIAISNAPKTAGSSVLRSVAYDIALNCLDPDTAAFQIKRRAGIERDDEQREQR